MRSKCSGTAPDRTIRIALAGCGVVGSEFARLVHEARFAASGVRLDIARVLVRDPERERRVPVPNSRFTTDLNAFLAEPADVVVEALGGLRPADRIAREALGRGARVVTANKALVGAMGDELSRLARRTGGALDFEAAVGGGMPVIRTLRDGLARRPVRRIRAILNGTTNYVLTRMEEGARLPDALEDARRAGFAEADPTRDLNGTDAGDKLRILAWLAYGLPPASLRIRQRGILPDPGRLVRDATAVGGSVRLVAECVAAGEGITASVEPVILPREAPFARTVDEEGRLEVDLGWRQPVVISGPGAGATPTASALLADVLDACGPLPDDDAAAPAPLTDHVPHSWLVSTHPAVGGLLRGLRSEGLDVRPGPGNAGGERVLVGPCAWARLEPTLQGLSRNGFDPLATRMESSFWTVGAGGETVTPAGVR